MKKLCTLIMVLLSSLLMTSCVKNVLESIVDGAMPESKYEFFEPYMEWGADHQTVTKYMKSISRDWEFDDNDDDEYYYSPNKDLSFINRKAFLTVTYFFVDGKLEGAQVMYSGINKKFDTMKKDVEKKYNVKFTEDELEYDKYEDELRYYGEIPSKKCDVFVGKGTLEGGLVKLEYMYVQYEYIDE